MDTKQLKQIGLIVLFLILTYISRGHWYGVLFLLLTFGMFICILTSSVKWSLNILKDEK